MATHGSRAGVHARGRPFSGCSYLARGCLAGNFFGQGEVMKKNDDNSLVDWGGTIVAVILVIVFGLIMAINDEYQATKPIRPVQTQGK